MSIEAKRSRHVAVAIPELRIRRGIAVSPRQKSTESQQPDVAYHQAVIGWRSHQPVDGGLGFGHVGQPRSLRRPWGLLGPGV